MLEEAAEEARRWGLDLPAGWEDETGFEGIWDSNEPALLAFLHVSGQWRTVSRGLGGSHYLGLDYTAAKFGLDLAGVTVSPATWMDLRLIENGALEELNRER